MKKSDLIKQIENKIEKLKENINILGYDNNPCVLEAKYRQQGALIALEEVLNALTNQLSNIDLI